jgi:hypothetical protein
MKGEHPPPTEATVKELYSHAFTCARPDCGQWLYRQDAHSAAPVLNSRVAHIHARRPGGARWKSGMSSAKNRDPSNLLLLCIPHSYEVDDHEERFPAELLQEWRLKQREEHSRLRRAWPLNDEEAHEVAIASFDTLAVSSQALADVARVAERLALNAQRSRSPVVAEAAAWRRTWEAARTVSFGWDRDGNSVYAEPSRLETRRHQEALLAALQHAWETVLQHAHEVEEEAAAARALVPRVADWCDWLTRAAADVVSAAARWPGPPPADDDDALPNAIAELRRAATALAAALRGDAASTPLPAPPQPPPGTVSRSGGDALRKHKNLLDRARPFSRVQHHPYDPDLRAQLAAAAEEAATIPFVWSAVTFGLRASAGLAAAVARNASPAEIEALIAQDRARRPLCAACALLHELRDVVAEQGREDLARLAEEALVQELQAQDWSQAETWRGNECNGRTVFGAWAWYSSPEQPRERLAAALRKQPERLHDLLLSCAEWIQRQDTRTGAVRYKRLYSDLPEWFPADVVTAVAVAVYPDVAPAIDRHDEQCNGEVEHLLSHVLRLALTRPAAGVDGGQS